MGRLFLVLLLLVVGVAALGFYRGWFSLTTAGEAGHGPKEIELKIDQDKMKTDVQNVKHKVSPGAAQAEDKKTGK
jgi:hypothetical protein